MRWSAFTRSAMNASDRFTAPARREHPPLRLLERPLRGPRPQPPVASGWAVRLERWAQRLLG